MIYCCILIDPPWVKRDNTNPTEKCSLFCRLQPFNHMQQRYVALNEDYKAFKGSEKETMYHVGDSFILLREVTLNDIDFYSVEGSSGETVCIPAVLLSPIKRVPWLTKEVYAM